MKNVLFIVAFCAVLTGCTTKKYTSTAYLLESTDHNNWYGPVDTVTISLEDSTWHEGDLVPVIDQGLVTDTKNILSLTKGATRQVVLRTPKDDVPVTFFLIKKKQIQFQ